MPQMACMQHSFIPTRAAALEHFAPFRRPNEPMLKGAIPTAAQGLIPRPQPCPHGFAGACCWHQKWSMPALAEHQAGEASKFIDEVFWLSYFKGYLETHRSIWTAYLALAEEGATGW